MSIQHRLRFRSMVLLTTILALLVFTPALSAQTSAPLACTTPVFVNEFHYDNDGTDTGEFIEVAGPAGTDLTGWTLVLYNGNGGTVYGTLNLSGPIPDQSGNGFGTVFVAAPGLQNGAPDGFALVDAGSNVQQFLSYEGTFTAVGGPADGMTSVDVGVSQPSNTPVGQSLQLSGAGECPEDFLWTGPATESPGAVNVEQTFGAGDTPPAVVSVTPADGAFEVPVDAAVSVTFSEPVAISSTIDIVCTSGTQSVTPTGGDTTFDLPHADFALGDSCSVTILASQVTDLDGDRQNMTADFTWSFDVTGGCGATATLAHAIQGDGLQSPLVGQAHVVEAVVVLDLQGVSSIRGFYVQEEDGDVDADPLTSEGLFIYDNNFGVDVAVGDVVRVAGYVSEFQQQTQISSVASVVVCPGDPVVTPSSVTLPFDSTTSPERYEGMSVVLPQTLTVADNYNLGRGGLVTLSSGRLQQPTNVALPGAPANDLQAANDRNQIILDDGSLVQNPDPIIYPPPELTGLNTLRSGDLVSGIEGVLSEGGSGWSNTTAYRIQPSVMPTFTAANPRPAAPSPARALSSSLKVGAFNLLNFFLTVDAGPDICGPQQNQDCRGADSQDEFDRQLAKHLATLEGLNADVLGLIELENTPGQEPVAFLVDQLNASLGAGTYGYIDTGLIPNGDHVIRVGLMYKPGVVKPLGPYALLTSAVDPNFKDDLSRPALAQTFEEIATGGRFTVVVNHLKSKGCTDATGLDQDQGDGQSCWNETRTLAAGALADWLTTDPTGMGDPDFLIVGDLNSYAKEDPIASLQGDGYTDLINLFEGGDAYSYVYFGQAGYLDHALSNASLTPQVGDAITWHINADEPSVLDYNTEFKSANQVNILFDPGENRSSDHDPTIVGLNLDPSLADLSIVKTASSETAKPGSVLTYTLTISNAGPALATSVVVTDQLPAETVFAAVMPYEPTCTESNGLVTCNLGDLAAGEFATVTIRVFVDCCECPLTLVNTAGVTSDTADNNPDNNTATLQTPLDCEPTAVELSGLTANAAAPVPVASVPWQAVAAVAGISMALAARRRR